MGTSDRFTTEDFAPPGVDQADVMELLKGVRDEVREMIERAKTEITLSIASAVEKRVVEKVSQAAEKFAAEVKTLREVTDRSTYKLERLIRAIPAPVINVAAPNVTMQPAEVNVTVPKQETPNVTVNVPKLEQPTVTVNVPQGKAPVVNVAAPNVTVEAAKVEIPEIKIPEQKAPVVNVEVPRRKVTKHITYSLEGRPETITEEEG